MKKYQKILAKIIIIVYNKYITFWAMAQDGRNFL